MTDFFTEKELIKLGYKFIVGVDEAGRGSLAGPVVAAVVMLSIDENLFIDVDDSKKLNSKKREILFELICDNSICYSIEMLDNVAIDEINILNATIKAMENAVLNLSLSPDYLLIDGNRYNSNKIPFRTIIKGDSICKSIAAASILAKVYRDKWMLEVADKEYPEYNFAKHKGYGTAEHISLIKQLGPCKYHRKSFLKKIINKNCFF